MNNRPGLLLYDSTTAAKIARYFEQKHLAYNLTKEGELSLDGAGRKIHKKGVVTLRNALGLHSLSERVTYVMREDVSLQGQWCGSDSVGGPRSSRRTS